MVGGSFLVVGESQALTPQTGIVNVTISYGGTFGPANNSTVFTINDFSGSVIKHGNGPTGQFTLPYGNYYVDVSPLYTVSSSGGNIIANGTVKNFTVDSSTLTSGSMPLPVVLSASKTTQSNLSMTGIASGSSVSVSLITPTGFTFEKFSLSSSKNYNNTVRFPNGYFYVKVNYAGATYTNLEHGTAAVSIPLSSTSNVYGFVTSQTGASISNVNAVIYDIGTQSYTVSHFTAGFYNLHTSSWTGKYVFIASPGYAAKQLTSTQLNSGNEQDVILQKANSSVYYNYSLSSDLHTLNLKVTYNLGNSTALPYYFGNSTIGSLYMQESMDGLDTTPSKVSNFLQALMANYTTNMISVAGKAYNISYLGTPVVTTSSGGILQANVNATYTSNEVASSLGSTGYSVELYALGTKTTPGSLYYHYNFTYSNPGLSLSSSSSSTSTFKSPILLNPVTSSQWVTLTLKPVKEPAVVDSEINLFWTGITSNNYVLNTSATNTAFIAPNGVPVSLNASNAYFNPVTGTNDYQYATFTWQVVGGSMYTGYNTTITFNAPSTKVILNATSPSGSTNTSTFTVITSTANPSANYSVSLAGKTLSSGPGAPSPVSITVPQSSLVTYSAYLSSLNVSGYSVPLEYHWYMPGYASAAQNITYAFSKPYIATGVGLQTAYLNVSTVFGTYKNVTFSVNVTDTTPPVPSMKLTNAAGSSISQPTAGAPTVFSANTSTDPYYATSQLTYSWAVKYPNGTAVKNGSSTYNVVGGSMTGSYVMLKFNTLSTMVVSLKATNPSNVSAYNNKTVNMIVNTPRIVVNSIYVKDNLTQGSQSTIYINVSNNGTVTANDFSIAILINGNPVASQTYARNLTVGQSANVSFNYTPTTSGKVTLVFQANNSSEPAFMAPLGSYTTTLTINAPAYKTPLIIGSIIAVIVIVGLVYYRLSSGKTTKKPKQQPKPKTELKKPAEKKK